MICLIRRGPEILFLSAAGGLLGGGVAWWLGYGGAADVLWLLVTAASCVPAAWWVLDGLLHGRFGSDVIAVLALGGTIAVREYLAGAVIGVMLTGGDCSKSAPGGATRDTPPDTVRPRRTEPPH